MKDTKITTPDFKVTTQKAGGETGQTAAYEIDLKTLVVSDDGVAAGSAASYTGLLEFTLINKTSKQEKKVQLSAKALTDEVTNGKIETKANEPVMTWRAKCAGTNCSKYYLVVSFHFHDNQGKYQDMRNLVIGYYRDLKQVRRALLENDTERTTLTAMVKALEAMPVEKTVPPTPSKAVVAKDKATAASAAAAGTGQTAASTDPIEVILDRQTSTTEKKD